MSNAERFKTDWSMRESALRSTYREWAAHRAYLMRCTLSENPAESPRLDRIAALSLAAETAPSLAAEWSRSSRPEASLRRAQMLAENVQGRDTVDDFLSQVVDLMQRELLIASELSEQVSEAMSHD